MASDFFSPAGVVLSGVEPSDGFSVDPSPDTFVPEPPEAVDPPFVVEPPVVEPPEVAVPPFVVEPAVFDSPEVVEPPAGEPEFGVVLDDVPFTVGWDDWLFPVVVLFWVPVVVPFCPPVVPDPLAFEPLPWFGVVDLLSPVVGEFPGVLLDPLPWFWSPVVVEFPLVVEPPEVAVPLALASPPPVEFPTVVPLVVDPPDVLLFLFFLLSLALFIEPAAASILPEPPELAISDKADKEFIIPTIVNAVLWDCEIVTAVPIPPHGDAFWYWLKTPEAQLSKAPLLKSSAVNDFTWP